MCARFPNRPHPETTLDASDHWTFGGQARRRHPGGRAPMMPRADADAWRLVPTGQQDDFRPLHRGGMYTICTCDRAPRWALSFVSSHRSFVSPTCPATARHLSDAIWFNASSEPSPPSGPPGRAGDGVPVPGGPPEGTVSRDRIALLRGVRLFPDVRPRGASFPS